MNNTRFLVQAAVIAAIYASLTILLAPISYGPVQVRLAEALTVLPALTPAAMPGLFLGCLIANMLGPYGMVDVLLGSGATLIAAALSFLLRKQPLLVPLPPILTNGLIIGSMLYYVYKVPVSLPLCILWVALGQAVACYGAGYPLLRYLSRRATVFRI